LIHHMHMLLLIGSAILFTNQAHFLSPYENQPQPHRSKARGIVTNTATVPFIDHELFMQAKVPRPAKTRQTCQEFYGPQFLPLAATRSGHFLYRNSRLHPPDKYRRKSQLQQFMEPEVHVKDAFSNNAKVVSSTSRLKGMGQLKSSTVTTSPILSDLILPFPLQKWLLNADYLLSQGQRSTHPFVLACKPCSS
jgi:hypothetical protein